LLKTRTHEATTIAELYLRRWEVELFFDEIKTCQNKDMLRCKSPEMVARELLMHLIAYNVVRLLMAQAEPCREVGRPGCLSLKETLDRMNQWRGTLRTVGTAKERKQSYSQLLDDIASDIVPPRPGRYEPQVLKRRRDSDSLLTKPQTETAL
jgi:IS4 transposase